MKTRIISILKAGPGVLGLGVVFSVSAIVAGGVAWAAQAHAAANLMLAGHSAIECRPLCGATEPCLRPQYNGVASSSGNLGQYFNLTLVPLVLACPAPVLVQETGGTNYSNPIAATSLSVSGYANTTPIAVSVCITYSTGGGGACGTAVNSATEGNYTTTLSPKYLVVWTGAVVSDGFWVKVTLPAPVNSGRDYADLFAYSYY